MPGLRRIERLAIRGEQPRAVEERRNLEDADAEAGDDRPRIAVHDVTGAARQLDDVPVHDERDRRAVEARAIEAVQGLSGDPARVARVADDEAAGPFSCFQ